MKRNRFGRQVTKTERYIGFEDKGTNARPAKVKTKTVRKGNTLKTRQVIKQDGKRIVNKTKKYETGDTSVTKKTVRGNAPGLNKERSVTVKKPGEKFVTTGLGSVGQARTYNYHAKKLKK